MPPRAFCDLCRCVVSWLDQKEVALQGVVTTRTVWTWIDTGLLHIWERPNGRCLICEKSMIGLGRGRVKTRRGLRLIAGRKNEKHPPA